MCSSMCVRQHAIIWSNLDLFARSFMRSLDYNWSKWLLYNGFENWISITLDRVAFYKWKDLMFLDTHITYGKSKQEHDKTPQCPSDLSARKGTVDVGGQWTYDLEGQSKMCSIMDDVTRRECLKCMLPYTWSAALMWAKLIIVSWRVCV